MEAPVTDQKLKEKYNLRGDEYWILETRVPCVHCKKETRVTALMLPEAFEEVDEESEEWEHREGRFIMSNIERVTANVHKHLVFVNPFCRVPDESAPAHSVMVNHCEHCQAEIDNEYLYGPRNFLNPLDDEQFENGLLRRVVTPFAAQAGYVLVEDMWEGARTVEIWDKEDV
jgi:hypothetical protein